MQRLFFPFFVVMLLLPFSGCSTMDHHHHRASQTQLVDDVYDDFRGESRIQQEEHIRRRLIEERELAE